MPRLWDEEMGPCEGYEPETVRVFNAVLKEGDYAIICGAHQGYFASVCSALVGKTGKVFAFEPDPKNFTYLKETCGGMGNVELFNFALGDRKTKAKFYINADNDGGHALWDISLNPFNVETKKKRETMDVDVNTIDDLFVGRDMSRLKLLMLDAEGSEHAIIRGGMEIITNNDVPYIVCEINHEALRHCGTSQMELRDAMAVNGYKAYWMEADKATDIGSDEWIVLSDKTPVVFNILFSRCGAV
jgi:FkbM family methyltransferase